MANRPIEFGYVGRCAGFRVGGLTADGSIGSGQRQILDVAVRVIDHRHQFLKVLSGARLPIRVQAPQPAVGFRHDVIGDIRFRLYHALRRDLRANRDRR